MPRYRRPVPSTPPSVSEVEFLPKAKRKAPKTHTSRAEKFTTLAREKIEYARGSSDPGAVWRDCSSAPDLLVGLYSVFHEHVYGVLPEELRADWLAAYSAARKMIRDEFRDDAAAAADFVRWCWAREKKQFPGRRNDWRIGWRYQFVQRSLITDYRVFVARSGPQNASRHP